MAVPLTDNIRGIPRPRRGFLPGQPHVNSEKMCSTAISWPSREGNLSDVVWARRKKGQTI